ncbi:MAG: hypothetical protein ACNI3C_07815 [Candidatus Marinarcus sp.]|uniref:hypothetical protein n=1 Tax=Candidatus Marinarcus sp. TaxID=3100987 RepID=UPI003B006B53
MSWRDSVWPVANWLIIDHLKEYNTLLAKQSVERIERLNEKKPIAMPCNVYILIWSLIVLQHRLKININMVGFGALLLEVK